MHLRRLWLLVLLILFLILATLVTLQINQIKLKAFLITSLNQFLESNRLFEKSTALISAQNGKLKLKINIIQKDKEKAKIFFENLTINPSWNGEVAFGLDSNSLNLLSGSLPLTVDLEFDGGTLKFKSKSKILLDSALPKNTYQFSTDSGKLTFMVNSDRDYYLEILKPEPLLRYATESGQLNLSSKISPDLFKVSTNLDRIEVRVNGKSVEGEIWILPNRVIN